MNKNEENRILYLLEYVNILNNLIQPEKMDNFNSNIDNKMEEEEEEMIQHFNLIYFKYF